MTGIRSVCRRNALGNEQNHIMLKSERIWVVRILFTFSFMQFTNVIDIYTVLKIGCLVNLLPAIIRF